MKYESFAAKVEKESKKGESIDTKVAVPDVFVKNPELLQDPHILETFTENMRTQEVQQDMLTHDRKKKAIDKVSQWENMKNIGRGVLEQGAALGGAYWLGNVMQNGFEIDPQTTALTAAAAGLTASGLAIYRVFKKNGKLKQFEVMAIEEERQKYTTGDKKEK